MVALTDEEMGLFFPGELETALRDAGFAIARVDPAAANWDELIRDGSPEAVIGGWSMQALPESSAAACGGSVNYLCYVTGSVRKKVTREMIEKGLLVTNWGDLIGKYVAEYTLMLILCALRRTMHYGTNLKIHGQWRQRETGNASLFKRRVGLHGFGSIARALVDLLKPFEVEISAHTGVPDAILQELGVKRAGSEESLFAGSDVLVELKPLTPATEKSVGEALLRLLPEGACFINVGRGAVVDETALYEVAKDGRIQVALDVYAVEPLPGDSPLRSLPNVTLLPHMGGATVDRNRACGELAIGNLEKYLAGENLDYMVTAEAYDRAT